MNKKITVILAAILLAVASISTVSLISCGEKEPSGIELKEFSSLADIGIALKDGLDDDYFGDLTIDSDVLDAMFGVNSEWVEDFYAEMAQISDDHNDRIVLVKASEGHTADVEAALKDYLEFDFNLAAQYPQNVERTRAAQIYVNGSYIALLVTGSIDPSKEDSANYQHALESNQKAISIIEEYIGGKA